MIIIGTLIYVLSKNKDAVLMVHRHKRASDDQLGFYNGLGGKLENGETIIECMQRELMEEANIKPTDFTLKGFVHWEGFGKKRENWLGAVFLVEDYEGDLLQENPEGSLEFVAMDRLYDLPLFDGDKAFLPKVFEKDQPLFHAHLSYDGKIFTGGRCTRGQEVEFFENN